MGDSCTYYFKKEKPVKDHYEADDIDVANRGFDDPRDHFWTCPKCQKENDLGNSYCSQCGEKYYGIFTTPFQDDVPTVNIDTKYTWKCDCGHENKGIAILCAACKAGRKFSLSGDSKKPPVDRPAWDEYFISMAFLVAQRSIDPTKHGVVVVAEDKTILSVGYNSPPRGCHDDKVPLTRPDKYYYMSHAEINAIANAARHGVCLKDSTFYITGHPCAACFRSIINAGAKKIIYGPVHSVCIEDGERKAIKAMMESVPVILEEYKKGPVGDTIIRTTEYMRSKCGINLSSEREKQIDALMEKLVDEIKLRANGDIGDLLEAFDKLGKKDGESHG